MRGLEFPVAGGTNLPRLSLDLRVVTLDTRYSPALIRLIVLRQKHLAEA